MQEYRLQLLTTKFEKLRMLEDETVGQYHARVCDISNEASSLGEKFSEERVVRKFLRSLPKRFAYKVTTTMELKDTEKMKLEELIGSHRIFEMHLEEDKA